MTYYPDLSPYRYLPRSVAPGTVALNVGWLAFPHRFPKGEPPAGFTAALGVLCRDRTSARTRGFRSCGLPHRPGEPRAGLSADVGGTRVPLGSAEIRVVARTGELLIAPTLIHHYVTRHRYLPPDVLVEAVTAGRLPGQAPPAPDSSGAGGRA